jgi:hypothetical protein
MEIRPYVRVRVDASAKRPEGCSELLREELRLLPRREGAPVDLVEVHDVRVGLLRPFPRRLDDLAGEDGQAHGKLQLGGFLSGRDRGEGGSEVLPVEPRREVAVFVNQ